MSTKNEFTAEYAEKLTEYAEKSNISTNFSTSVTLSLDEHKMLVEGYKNSYFHNTKFYEELEIADLSDFMLLERRYGGTNL